MIQATIATIAVTINSSRCARATPWQRSGRRRPSPPCPRRGIDPPEGAHRTGEPWASLEGGIRFGHTNLLIKLFDEPEGGFSGPRTQPQRAHGGQREAGHAAVGADVRRDEPPAPVDRQGGEAEGQVPALAQHLLPALVQ